MKIALCISGDSSSQNYRQFFTPLYTYLLQPHTPDVYLHTWEHQYVPELCILYKPKAYLEEPLRVFPEIVPNTQSILQRLYSISKVNELVYLSNIEYQWVIHIDARTKLTGAIPFDQLEQDAIGLAESKMGQCKMAIAASGMKRMQLYSALFHLVSQVYAIRQEFTLESLMHQYLTMFDIPRRTVAFQYTPLAPRK